jgi:hypothetical protein
LTRFHDTVGPQVIANPFRPTELVSWSATMLVPEFLLGPIPRNSFASRLRG